MVDLVLKSVQAVREGDLAFCKFITANDTGATGGHQSGFHIHKNAYPLFFDSAGEKGINKDKSVKIKWQDTFETESRCIYYGVGTRNEYRLTRFGKGFPFLREEHIGDLLVLVKKDSDFYEAFVLSADEDIETFFSLIGISSLETNKLIYKISHPSPEQQMQALFEEYIRRLREDFPSSFALAKTAREICEKVFGLKGHVNPDEQLLRFISCEYELFKTIENLRYADQVKTPFQDVESLILFANSILNRRKSRAGFSLEHHLSAIFSSHALEFGYQVVTEGNKTADFIFPGARQYHDNLFNPTGLIFLASKTTCKDRWRQILNEANRIPRKHLFTLQQGISSNQLQEMRTEGVALVVPKPYIVSFPANFRDDILTLGGFIQMVKTKQA